jgi:hypothetical protein
VGALASRLHHGLRFYHDVILSLDNNTAFDYKMHEVITLQFGQQANHVGTHFWNAQVSHSISQPSHALRSVRLVIHDDSQDQSRYRQQSILYSIALSSRPELHTA